MDFSQLELLGSLVGLVVLALALFALTHREPVPTSETVDVGRDDPA